MSNSTCFQGEQLGLIPYDRWFYCHHFQSPLLIVYSIVLIQCFTALGITSSDYLCPNLSSISRYLAIPDNLSGLTLLLFGNGAPDIISTYSSFMSDNGSLAIGELIGALFLTTTLVIGVMSVVHPFHIYSEESELNDKLVFIRDISFFILSVILLIVFAADGVLKFWESLVLIFIYLLYVVIIVSWNWVLSMSNSRIQLDNQIRSVYNFEDSLSLQGDLIEESTPFKRHSLFDSLEFENLISNLLKRQSIVSDDLQLHYLNQLDTNNDTSEDSMVPIWDNFEDKSILSKSLVVLITPLYLLLKLSIPVKPYDSFHTPPSKLDRKLVLLQTVVAPIFIFITHFGVSLALIPVILISIAFSQVLVNYCYDKYTTQTNFTLCLLGFASSISWISIVATEIIAILNFVSHYYHLSDLILGLTVFAIGNSIGDLISNFTILRMGYPLMALLACFGGPLLNLLLGIGINGLLVLKLQDLTQFTFEIDSNLMISSVFLLLNLLFILVLVPNNSWKFDYRIGAIMITSWLLGTLINIIFASI